MSAEKAKLIRLSSVLAPDGPIPVSRSSWWAGIKTGRFPPGLKLGPRTTAWRESDIKQLVDEGRWTSDDGHRDASDSAGKDL